MPDKTAGEVTLVVLWTEEHYKTLLCALKNLDNRLTKLEELLAEGQKNEIPKI